MSLRAVAVLTISLAVTVAVLVEVWDLPRMEARRVRRRVEDDRRVLGALRYSPPAGGYDLWVRTGLRMGRVYLALARLENAGLVTGEFEDTPEGQRARRLYRVTEKGRAR